MRIKIMIVTNQPSLRIAVRRAASEDTVLDAIEILECDLGGGGNNAISEIRANSPSIVLLDIGYPIVNGLNLARRITRTFARIAVILLSANNEEDDSEVFEVAKSGAIAYLKGKQYCSAEIAEAIKQASMGERPIIEKVINDRKVAWRILRQFHDMALITRAAEVAFPFHLDLEEKQVLELIARGTQKNQITGILGISELTINERISSVLFKLNSNERTSDTFNKVRDSLLSVRLARDGNLFILNAPSTSRLPQLLHDGVQYQ